ncbi:MAG TPA: protein-glutamate O-methyltransferase CheR [Kofleriaceae bacterium]|nr:protein-glutamate O-methyltransferase CheR [Kofleriaceae bacterium]
MSTLSERAYHALAEVIYEHTGVVFDDGKRYVVERRLLPRLAATGEDNFDDYVRRLKVGAWPAELDEVIDRVTNHETYFFREAYNLRAFSDEVLPRVVRRIESDATRRAPRLTLWSAGCATGEEAYTIAMLVRERGLDRRIQGRVIGTDVSPAALRVARRGIYREPSFRGVDSRRVAAYFRAAAGGEREVVPEIKEMVSFSRASLMDADAHALFGDIDVAFCRNVLIYFDAESRTRAVRLLYDRLAPGGYLLLGHSETLVARASGFEVVAFRNDTVYRKPKAR